MIKRIERMIEMNKMDNVKRWALHVVKGLSREEVKELTEVLQGVLSDTTPKDK